MNETTLDDSILNGEVEIPGYDIVSCDRNRNGGGLQFTLEIIYHSQRSYA